MGKYAEIVSHSKSGREQKMKSVYFRVLLCLSLLCVGLPVPAQAAAGFNAHADHPVCGATCTHIESHTTATSWVVWDGTNTELSNSCYHISSDTDIISINNTISISGTVDLCLNGHTLAAKNIVVGEDAMLTLCDCSAGQTGKLILSPELSEGSITGIMVSADGKYTQYGGAVELSSSGTEAGQTSIFGVYSDGGNVNLHGGSITVDCQYGSGEPAAFAVSCYGGMFSATGGTITAEAKSGYTEADWPYACGIDLNDGASAEISGVTVSASAQGHGAGASAVGCFSGEAMIHSDTFNASAKGESSEAFGVYIDGGKVKVEDGSFTSEAEGMDDTDCHAYGIRCAGGSAVVSGGTFSTTSEGDGSEAYGIFLKDASASVTSGTFTVSTEGDESESYGLYAWNNDFSTENSIAVSGGSFSAEVKGETNEYCVACGIYLDDSCEKTTAVLPGSASFHGSAQCLYSNAYAVFNECPGLSITGGSYTAKAECTDSGCAFGVDDSAGVAITGGSFQTVSGWSAYGVSFDEAGGSVSGITASAEAPHATAVFFSGNGSVTDCSLTATGTEEYAASALALFNPVTPPTVTLSGGKLTANGESSVGVEINDGTVTLVSAPAVSATQADFSIVPTDSSGKGWYTGGTVRLGDSFSGGNYTLSCETGVTGFTEETVVVENVSDEQSSLFTLLPMEGAYTDWKLLYDAEKAALCIAPGRTASGTISGYEGKTYSGVPTATLISLEDRSYGAVVEQVQGESGKWTYTAAVPAGMYNLVVKATEEGEAGKVFTVTALVDLSEQDQQDDIQLPSGQKNSVVETEGDVHTIVGGLDEIAAASSENGIVEIRFRLSALETSSAPAADKTAIESLVARTNPGSMLKYFDFSLTKTVDSQPVQNFGSSNDKLITILIPYDLTGRDPANITVYRYHGGRAEALTRNPVAGAEGFSVGENFLIVYAKAFSTYAVAYSNAASTPADPPQVPGYPDDDSEPTYKVELPVNLIGGVITSQPKWVEAGDTVTLTVTLEDGYLLSALDVTDVLGNKLEMTDRGDGTYTFKMPRRKVTVAVAFSPDGSYTTCPGDHTCPIWPYTDAETTAWYHDGVHYIIEKSLMTGYGNGIFKPNTDTSRAMIAVMLWRLEGSPVVNYLLDFEDVKAEAWYTEAIRWAKSEGIIGGYGNGCWGPDNAVTREQMVTILWRYAQYKGYDVSVGEDTNILSYDDAFDVAEYAIPAMQWACGSGMVQGMNDPDGEGMILDPESKGTRAQIATMLMRFCEEIINRGR